MKCSKARQLIGRYVDAALPESSVAELKAHLQSCAACQVEEHNVRLVLRRLDEWPAIQPVQGFDALMERVQQRAHSTDRQPFPMRTAPSWAAATFAIAGVFVGALLGLLTSGSRPVSLPTEQQVAHAIELHSFDDSIAESLVYGIEISQTEEEQPQ